MALLRRRRKVLQVKLCGYDVEPGGLFKLVQLGGGTLLVTCVTEDCISYTSVYNREMWHSSCSYWEFAGWLTAYSDVLYCVT